MSEANETNDILTKIKEQIMIATHETGEMPSIRKSKKKADSNGGYFYDAQNNVLYVRDNQTWDAIKGNLSADLSSDDMGMNVSIQPLQGIDGYQGESIEDLQDKVDKVNRENHHEYYRLIKRGDYDWLLCYSFNNVADRDRFAAEMDDVLVVGSSDVSDGAKFDKYDDDEEIDEDFSDDEVLDGPSHRKQNDNGKQNDTQKEKAKVNKKKQKDDEKKKNDDDKEKKNGDDITKDNEEGEQEVTLVEELSDTQVNQTGGTQVNDNSVSGNAPGAEKPAQSIEARFAEVNAQPLPNRYAYLEQYCRIAKEFGEPDGYSLSKNMGNRKAFEVEDVNRNPGHCKEKKLQKMSRENLLMHMLSDILPAIAGGEVVHYRDNGVNTLYIKSPGVLVNFDSILNHERVRNSAFSGYFRSLINNLKPLAELMNLDKRQAAECVINFVMNDIGLMREFLDGVAWGHWKDNNGVEVVDLKTSLDGNGQHPEGIDKVILPYGWMRGEDFRQVALPNGQKKLRLTPRTVGFSDLGAHTYQQYAEVNTPKGDSILGAASIAFSCGDVFPSGDLKKNLYYCTWAGRDFPGSQTLKIVRDYGGASCNTYFGGAGVSRRAFIEALKQERASKRGNGDFLTTYFSPASKGGNLKKLLTVTEREGMDTPQVVFEDGGSMFTPPIIRNYLAEQQNLNSVQGCPGMQQPF